jgi:hypothetical protein
MEAHRDDGDSRRRDRAGTTQTKGLVMHSPSNELTLRVCSICLRVLRDGSWVAPETIILELRSFERASLPNLEPALCAVCEESIMERRTQPAERVAA